ELSAWLAPLQLTEMEVADVVLAVDEAAANAVRHASGPDEAGVVDLTLWTEGPTEGAAAGSAATPCIEVVDRGSWRPPSEGPTDAGGGLPLMSHRSGSVLRHFDERGSRGLLRHRTPEPGAEREQEQACGRRAGTPVVWRTAEKKAARIARGPTTSAACPTT